ncbi:hypothetical protein PSTG_02388 [Puccinia striiformis f. sp. tritici PST-78]|uniref:Uncharacterized protein n=1 Tax=Puccinia striiformis f. sp. tritici PST-78 TaxID=1165861 RepID=A0A0L0VZR1_9BASI|nr:hypothetical protein PSTG_02388 [Puccinia striiformis f. sp. tritici PST-78]
MDAEQPKKEKAAVMVPDLLDLVTKLVEGTEEDLAIMDLILVAFWGMGRLGELTSAARGNEQDYGPRMTTYGFPSTQHSLPCHGAKATLHEEMRHELLSFRVSFIRELENLNEVLSDDEDSLNLGDNRSIWAVRPLLPSGRGVLQECHRRPNRLNLCSRKMGVKLL